MFISGFSQITPEQQKEIEEAQAKAMEMMKNNPQFEEAMKMMEGAEEEFKQEKMMKAEEEKRREEAAKDRRKEFYWRNKVGSDTQGKFSDWSWGETEIGYYDGTVKRAPGGKIPYEGYRIVGKISSSGQVQMDLPSQVKNNRVISKGLFPEMHEISNDDINFSNPEAPFLWFGFTLHVLKDGKEIGSLYIGNSERATHNLAAPAFLNRGEEGYLAYWAYIGEACKATYTKENQNAGINSGEISKTVDRYTRLDLNFKPGWNLVKIEIKGHHSIGQVTFWKTKEYSVVPEMPSDARYYFRYDTPN